MTRRLRIGLAATVFLLSAFSVGSGNLLSLYHLLVTSDGAYTALSNTLVGLFTTWAMVAGVAYLWFWGLADRGRGAPWLLSSAVAILLTLPVDLAGAAAILVSGSHYAFTLSVITMRADGALFVASGLFFAFGLIRTGLAPRLVAAVGLAASLAAGVHEVYGGIFAFGALQWMGPVAGVLEVIFLWALGIAVLRSSRPATDSGGSA